MIFKHFLETSTHPLVVEWRKKQEARAQKIGEILFKYHDTYGLPINTILDVFKEVMAEEEKENREYLLGLCKKWAIEENKLDEYNKTIELYKKDVTSINMT